MKENYSKIKNIIFDLDNTIVLFEEDCILYYKDTLKKYGYDEKDYIKVSDAIDEYDYSIDENNLYYNKYDMQNFINRKLNKNYSTEFIDELIDVVGKYWTKTVLIKEDVLKYLFEKYNLYIYTNYFQDTQKERIKNIGYLKYFKGILGADKYGSKPFKKGMENVLKEINAKPEECIMVGDTKDKEILSASLVNMKAILVDYDGKRDKKEIKLENYISISNVNELKNIL